MENLVNVVQTVNYGKFVFKLDEVLAERKISISSFSRVTGIDYRALKRMTDKSVTRADLDSLARICFSLKCSLEEIIEYIPPK